MSFVLECYLVSALKQVSYNSLTGYHSVSLAKCSVQSQPVSFTFSTPLSTLYIANATMQRKNLHNKLFNTMPSWRS